jgi:phosphatidylglycerophosphate synthase
VTSFAESLTSLRSAQKPAKGTPTYTLYVNRPLGKVCAAAGHAIGMTPNVMTALSLLVTLSGVLVLVLAQPTPQSGIAVWFLLATGFVLDSADGQLARLRGGGSPDGEWFDHVGDAGKLVLLHLAVAVMLFRDGELPAVVLLVPLVYAVSDTVRFAGGTLADLIRRAAPTSSSTAPVPRGGALLRSVTLLPVDYGLLCATFVLLGWPWLFVWSYGLLGLLSTVLVVAMLAKWYREMVALRPTPSKEIA